MHGTAEIKEDFNTLKKGSKGVITAYLPEYEKFAVMFDFGLITFSMTEDEFKDICTIKLNEL